MAGMAQRSRAERLERVRGRRRRIQLIAVAAAVVVCGALVAVAIAMLPDAEAPEPARSLATTESEPATLTAKAAAPAVPVEVPVLTGMPISEAEVLLSAAGLTLVRIPTPAGEAAEGIVLSQDPAAGTRVSADTPVSLVYADTAAAAAAASTPSAASGSTGIVVCIDPGHQASANGGLEPIGPGATEQKAKVTGGAAGVVTRQAEHELVLAISLKVKERLERYGVTVVMTRTTASVDISNSQRAAVANQAGAGLFLRIHADSNTNADVRGISTLYAGGNDWVAPIETESLRAAGILQKQVLASTAAADRGVVKRSDLSGFNYATVPSVLVETGFLSNPVDDRQLADAAYQDRLADGIARGVLAFLGVTK
jgi:N-acetylmuramoyl-L-alanine amidase